MTTTTEYATPTTARQTPDLMGAFRWWSQVAMTLRHTTAGDDHNARLRAELVAGVRSGDSGLDLDALARVDQDLWGMPEPK